ncbi:ATP phosphoribosyltransferase regulatory subunit [Scytonema sp. PRP1]|uniref:ATP phosphoribosyltransferase regulatory subunit n=1 Tax=Scytonema sp. PRP1 TaxID=3120513 RepID=UPI002FD67FBB
MVYQSPVGARDLLPLDVAQKHWIEDRLQQVFHRWGYHKIITSTLERMDTLMAGGAIQRSAVIQLQNADDEDLGLRPELTASIARTAVTRMAGVTYPQRLYYNANVFQGTSELKHNRQQEFYQAGVELLGSGGNLADAEILLLVAECLQALGLNQWHLILGEAQITRSLLKPFPAHLQGKIRSAIAHLDRVTIDTLPLSDELRERAIIMLDLRGNPDDVLQKVTKLGLDQPLQAVVDNLKSLVELLKNTVINTTDNQSRGIEIILDLSLLQTFDYYTGIVFEVISDTDGQARVVGRGGRYDQLLGLYHPKGENIPGIGFALFLEDLQQILLSARQLPQTTPASNWLIVPETPDAYAAAFAYATKLRDSIHLVRVEMDLGGRDADEIRQYAGDRHVAQIAWIKADGTTMIESLVK